MMDIHAQAPHHAPWQWTGSIAMDGIVYRARDLPSPVPGWQRTLIIDGLPERYWSPLMRVALAEQNDLAWKVLGSSREPDDEPSLAPIRRDLDVYRTRFLTALGLDSSGELALVGCVGIRPRITPDVTVPGWIVLARALVVPGLRGRGLSRHFGLHFMHCSQTLCHDAPAMGLFFETGSPYVWRDMERARGAGLLDFVRLRIQRFADSRDETCIAFYRGVRSWLLARGADARRACAGDTEMLGLIDAVDGLWRNGADTAACMHMGSLFRACEARMARVSGTTPSILLYRGFLDAMRAWGGLSEPR